MLEKVGFVALRPAMLRGGVAQRAEAHPPPLARACLYLLRNYVWRGACLHELYYL